MTEGNRLSAAWMAVEPAGRSPRPLAPAPGRPACMSTGLCPCQWSGRRKPLSALKLAGVGALPALCRPRAGGRPEQADTEGVRVRE